MSEFSPAYNGCTCICHTQPGVMHIAPCCSPSQSTLVDRVLGATVSSCTCGTKTPAVDYHAEDCTYRVLCEVHKLLTSNKLYVKCGCGWCGGTGNKKWFKECTPETCTNCNGTGNYFKRYGDT